MLSLGCGRLPPTPTLNKKKKKKKKKKKEFLDHYLHHDLGILPLLWCFFAHLLILQYPDHHQNLISSSLYYSGPRHKISSQSVHSFLSNVVHRQTNRRTIPTLPKTLEALRERRPPWPRQVITLILPTVKMLSLGCEKDPPPKKKKKKKKGSGSLPAPRSGYATTIMVVFCSFIHLTIPRSPPKFNQFFLLLLGTPPSNFIPIRL